ncbi:MAG: hypothetical protein M3377_04440, partial [Actinomycetota bacterium]|nr:hypothetical protein [Actinomycetota bacterium]
RAPRRNPIGDLLRCGRCGGRYEWNASGTLGLLRCENRKAKMCDAPSLAPENVEVSILSALSAAYTALSEWLEDPTWTWAVTDAEERQHSQQRLADVAIELAAIEQEAARLHNAYVTLDTLEADEYAALARDVRARRVALETLAEHHGRTEETHREALEALRDNLGAEDVLRDRAGSDYDTIAPALRPFGYWHSADVEEKAAYLRTAVNTITVEHDDYVAVAFKPGPVLTYTLRTKRDATAAIFRSYGFGDAGDNGTRGNHGFPHAESTRTSNPRVAGSNPARRACGSRPAGLASLAPASRAPRESSGG